MRPEDRTHESGRRGAALPALTAAEEVTNLVEREVAFQELMKADAGKTVTALIQGYLGPDHKVIDMPSFYSALSQALREAREQGQVDRAGQVLTML
jgi:hypothetical protein